MSHQQSPEHVAFDVGTIILIMGSFIGYLPPIAAGLAGIWYCVLLYDRFFKNSKSDRNSL